MAKPLSEKLSLPVSTGQVLDNTFTPTQALDEELLHGNGDLIKGLQIIGTAGPFTVVSPWELEDETGRRRINAGGYAATPFGERYPPLVDFIGQFLAHDRSQGLPQQAASTWRAALETNLVSLLAHFAPSHADSRVFFSNSGAEGAVGIVARTAPNKSPAGCQVICMTGSIAYRLLKRKSAIMGDG